MSGFKWLKVGEMLKKFRWQLLRKKISPIIKELSRCIYSKCVPTYLLGWLTLFVTKSNELPIFKLCMLYQCLKLCGKYFSKIITTYYEFSQEHYLKFADGPSMYHLGWIKFHFLQTSICNCGNFRLQILSQSEISCV